MGERAEAELAGYLSPDERHRSASGGELDARKDNDEMDAAALRGVVGRLPDSEALDLLSAALTSGDLAYGPMISELEPSAVELREQIKARDQTLTMLEQARRACCG